MGRSSSSAEESGLKRGPWTPEEDEKLIEYISKHGHGSWRTLPLLAGLNRCGKSCRLRWMNYLRPDIRRGNFSEDEERLIVHLHSITGNKWSQIAAHLPGRTDNEIKNFWNTRVRKKLLQKGIDPETHKPIPTNHIPNNLLVGLAIAQSLGGPNNNNLGSSAINPWEIMTCTELAKILVVHNLIQSIGTNNPIVDQSAYDTLLQPYSNSESRNITPGANPNMINIHWPIEYSWASSGSGNAELPSEWPSSCKESTDSTPSTGRFSTEPNASMDVFEDLDKLMEDDTCASFLRDFLEE